MEHSVLHRRLADDLSPALLYALLRLRVEVFVVEQACPYQELDGADLAPSTRHYWLSPPNVEHEPIACLRMTELPDGVFRLSRLCASRVARGQGGARRLIQAALGEIGSAPCVLDAQSHLTEVYTSFGFAPTGPEFVEDGIAHVPMRRG